MPIQIASPKARDAFARHTDLLRRELERARDAGVPIRLRKRTSNLFRPRRPTAARAIDTGPLNVVMSIDPETRIADVGGMTPYEDLVAATLPHGLMPAVVPELKSITVGGAVTGGGIESSSFRYGFVHETVRDMDILTADGNLTTCTPDNRHRALFFGFANSYGTLGYALRLGIQLIPAQPFVHLTHRRHHDAEAYFQDMETSCRAGRADPAGTPFIDGVAFAEHELVRTSGEWRPAAAATSDYTFMRRYYRSIRQRDTDCLRTADYIWRWDTDWFWCARAFGMENHLLRFLAGSVGALNSSTYWKLRDWNERTGLLRKLGLLKSVEWVIQDVQIPVRHAATFLRFLRHDIGIHPVWICPAMAAGPAAFPLYRMASDTLYINFGFWGSVPDSGKSGCANRRVEARVAALDGRKSLYSSSFFTREEFWSHYNEPAYRALKERYDPDGFFPDLYEKCVQPH